MVERADLLSLTKNGYHGFFLINDVLSIFFFVLLLVMPVFVGIFYYKNFNKLSQSNFNETWGSTYDGLRTDKKYILFFPIFFLARRFIFIILAFNLKDKDTNEMYSSIFLFILMLMVIVILIYL